MYTHTEAPLHDALPGHCLAELPRQRPAPPLGRHRARSHPLAEQHSLTAERPPQ